LIYTIIAMLYNNFSLASSPRITSIIDVLRQKKQGKLSSHLYFFALHRSQACAARGLFLFGSDVCAGAGARAGAADSNGTCGCSEVCRSDAETLGVMDEGMLSGI